MLYDIHFRAADHEGVDSLPSKAVTQDVETALLDLGLQPIVGQVQRSAEEDATDWTAQIRVDGVMVDVRELVSAWHLVKSLKETPATTVFAFKDPTTGQPVLVIKDLSKEETDA